MTKQFGRTTVYATTPEAVKKLESGWQPCNKKKGCGCAVKPEAKPENTTVSKKETVEGK